MFRLMIKIYFDQDVTKKIGTNEITRTLATSQRDDYTTFCLLEYLIFKEKIKLIGLNLRKQQTLNVDPK